MRVHHAHFRAATGHGTHNATFHVPWGASRLWCHLSRPPPPPGPPLFPPLQTGMPDDRLPEVPPDGNITLGFTYPVNLAMLQSALRIEGAPGASAQVGRGWAGHPWHARRARVCSPPGTSS